MSSKSIAEVQAARAFSLKNYPRAINHLSELLEFVGENPHTLHMLAVCHARQGDLAQALKFVERALRADPRHLESLKLAAQLHLQRGEQSQARRYVALALQLHNRSRAEPAPRPGWFRSLLDRLLLHEAAGAARHIAGPGEQRRWLEWAEAFVSAAPPTDNHP